MLEISSQVEKSILKVAESVNLGGKVKTVSTLKEKCEIEVLVHWEYASSQVALTDSDINTSIYSIGTFTVTPEDALGLTAKKIIKPICKRNNKKIINFCKCLVKWICYFYPQIIK